MKKLLIFLVFAVFSCSSDDSVQCGDITARGWNLFDGDYIVVDGHPGTIPVPDKDNYNIGENYCW